MAETFLDGRVTLHAGDCLEVLAALPDNSVDSVVTDPPYHLTSIVKRFGASDSKVTVTKPESAVFKRQASGFMGQQWDGGDIAFRPEVWRQCLRVLRPGGYLLAFASTRGIWRMGVAIEDAGFIAHPMIAWVFGSGFPKATRIKAEGLDGWRYGGQSLKPAIEPVFMGQKPFSEANGTANILKHGTGAVNIDACRVGSDGTRRRAGAEMGYHGGNLKTAYETGSAAGRWPANVIHDGSEEVLAAFPEAPGALRGVDTSFAPKAGTAVFGDYGARPEMQPRGDVGSAARFFYSAKADSDDRIGSRHPTVKPVDLMRYLVRLVTPPGGTVLDPFAGTGTTGEAAFYEGFSAVLIEREAEYRADIARRMALSMVGPDERRRKIAKAKAGADATADAGPLFSLSPQAMED